MALPPQLSFVLYVSAFALGFPLNLLAIRGTVAHTRLRLTPSLVYVLHLSWFPGLPGSLGSQLGPPCPPQFLHPALLSALGHHCLLLCGLPPGPGPLKPEPQAEAQGSLGGWGSSSHTAALLGALQCLQCG